MNTYTDNQLGRYDYFSGGGDGGLYTTCITDHMYPIKSKALCYNKDNIQCVLDILIVNFGTICEKKIKFILTYSVR